MQYIWLSAGLVLIASGIINVISLSTSKTKPNRKGEIPTENQIKIYRFISVVTFVIGIYLFFGTLLKMR